MKHVLKTISMNTTKVLVNSSTLIEFSYFPGVQVKKAGPVKFQFLPFFAKIGFSEVAK